MSGLASLLDKEPERAPSSASFAEPPEAKAEVAWLRLALAVRGWVEPRQLLSPGLAPETIASVLDTVATEVETAWQAHPGKWYLRDPERRLVLTATPPDQIDAALGSDTLKQDADDPVRQVLRLRRSPLPVDISTLGTEVLASLAKSLVWLAPGSQGSTAGDFWHQEDEFDARERIAATLALVRRQQDVARMTSAALFGRHEALSRLVQIAAGAEPEGPGGAYAYLCGIGGAGKSTVLAHLEDELSKLSPPPLLVHLDCDQPGFDPTDPNAMDMALFRRVGLARPDRAADLRQRIGWLGQAAREAGLSYTERTTSARPVSRTRQPAAKKAAAKKPVAKKLATKAAVASYSALEAAVTEQASARHSISWNALKDVGAGAPLVLLIDTAELIFARGQDATLMVANWICSLEPLLGVRDLRVILAGRDPADAPGPSAFAEGLRLSSTSSPLGPVGAWKLHQPITIGDLNLAEATAMLMSLGIDDPILAERTAAILPRTPLILRIAADLHAAGTEERAAFIEAVSKDGIDPLIISRYLTERIVRHMASLVARPYVLAAMVLPEVTPKLVAEVVIPAVELGAPAAESAAAAERHAQDVFEGLTMAGWLVRPTLGKPHLTFHPEVRRLTLSLMGQHEEKKALVARVREDALAFYEPRRARADKTFAAYFAELLGRAPPQAGYGTLKPEALGSAIEDLSGEAQARLFGAAGPPAPGGTYAHSDSEAEWRLRLEGTGQRDGEGDRLVKRARAVQALALYRSRPTRPAGIPPTFVLQALADNAEWNTGEVHVQALVEELRADFNRSAGRSVPNALRSRLYWLTRYALLAGRAALADDHWTLLRDVAARITGRGPVLLFPAILAVAEAMAPKRGPLAPDQWFDVRGPIESETRMYLVSHLHFARQVSWQPHLDALVATQPDWCARAGAAHPELLRFDDGLPSLQDMEPKGVLLGQLMGFEPAAPLDLPGLNAELRDLRRSIRVTLDARMDAGAAVLLLRGLTSEVHRPLRAAVARFAATSEPAREALRAIAQDCVAGLGFKTREFIGVEFDERLARDVAGVYTILIPFADRCRRLPDLCERLGGIHITGPEAGVVQDVVRTFLTWDAAICANHASNWPDPPQQTRSARHGSAASKGSSST
ncbi:hypothetical protein [Ancylobacter polymorphus]|uniref:Orc1-like AAA ATPase domain-containing protein n=1 Tax=Ancylobacter polymorphus TaxID=223390 RepID=A0ABU0BFA7_9HYPH|nr:hypothetical protein [Ancylobacter polymorphus]MDQ0304501.1 hypothetical protein [Ancylobacter polymorphus]